MDILGIDIGGSGIKGAIVDVTNGQLLTERHRIPTPKPATPGAVGKALAELVNHFKWKGPIGATFPAIIRHNIAYSAANVHDDWIGTNDADVIEQYTGCKAHVINDADAVGIAEQRFGGGKQYRGTVFLITVGTGLGTALMVDGGIVPNTELGHLILPKHGHAESFCSDAARKRDDLKWKEWAKRFECYLAHLEHLFSPEVFVIGGGVSKKPEKFVKHLNIQTPVKMAELKNLAGIIGAAVIAEHG
ncbi:MAG: polyphosphate--glucose phosphotransferase [Puniceicoccaceae bacterium]